MELKLLLLKSISALYYSALTKSNRYDSVSELIDGVINHLPLNDRISAEVSKESGSLQKLRGLLIWMKGKARDYEFDLADLMTRLRVACGDNDRLYSLFEGLLTEPLDPEDAGRRLENCLGDLYEFVAVEEFSDLLRKASRAVSFDRDKIGDLSTFKEELSKKLQGLSVGGKRRAAMIGRHIDISDVTGVEEVYAIAQTAIDPRAILKLAYKAMNRMTGDQEGARRGEWSNVSALPGQNKSGNLLDTFISMCIFNSPVLFDESKKPLHIYTTIEDKAELVMQKLYVMLKQHETGLPVIVRDLLPKEMAEYVNMRLSANGWNVRIVELPGGTNVSDYVEMLRAYQEDGYEIVSAGCDYVNLLGKEGLPAVTAGDEVQLTHRTIRSFTAPANIYHYTAHQLSTDAKTLARQFPDDYVKRLPGKGYYEGCKKLDTEFDFEYIVAKTVHGGHTWQEFQWSKHRKMGATNESAKYFALKFQELPMIGFKYDYDLDIDLSYRKIGARTTGQDGSAWNDFD